MAACATSMRDAVFGVLCAAVLCTAPGLAGPLTPEPVAPRLGQPVEAAEAARRDISVFADGRGLPPGSGTAAGGRALFDARCVGCHGEGGRGASAEEVAGGSEPLTSEYPDRTMGLYWPHATTVFDFLRRSKPMDAPGSLSDDEVYALTAWLLYANGVIGEADEMNAKTLPRVRMPNRDGFLGIDAKPPPSRGDGAR